MEGKEEAEGEGGRRGRSREGGIEKEDGKTGSSITALEIGHMKLSGTGCRRRIASSSTKWPVKQEDGSSVIRNTIR